MAPQVREAVDDGKKPAVSHLPILPPLWARVPGDKEIYPRPKPLREVPQLLTLDGLSSCPCGETRSAYDPSEPTVETDCMIYTLLEALPCRIQLQRCKSCPMQRQRAIGPDPRNLGIFNYDNRILLTHDLLDDYTSNFTSSETPFVAWVGVIARRYEDQSSVRPFISHEQFRAAWFSYTAIQELKDDLECPRCGPYPEHVIFDGVTLAFNLRHLLPTLKPPTIPDENSPVRNSRYLGKQQAIQDGNLRKEVKSILQGKQLLSKDELDQLAANVERSPADSEKLSNCLKLALHIDSVCTSLSKVNSGLGWLFRHWFSTRAASVGLKAPIEYKDLFMQVSDSYQCLM